jgi:transcriptional regulator with XRE-family HTH domain
MGQSPTVFAHESPTRSAGFDAENSLYLFVLTVPRKVLTQLRDVATSSPTFDRDLAVKIGKCMTVRRDFCRLSTQQLGARLGIDSMEVEAYEQGEKRMSCRLLLETAKQLKATPRFFVSFSMSQGVLSRSYVWVWYAERYKINRANAAVASETRSFEALNICA